jgi:hypothetical protein
MPNQKLQRQTCKLLPMLPTRTTVLISTLIDILRTDVRCKSRHNVLLTKYQAMKTYGRSRGIAPLINLGTRWREVNGKPHAAVGLLPRKQPLVPTAEVAGWIPKKVWLDTMVGKREKIPFLPLPGIETSSSNSQLNHYSD